MSVIHPYYSWIPGGQSVAEQIDAIDGVSYVESGPFGPSTVPFSKISAPAMQEKCICLTLNHQRKYQKLKIYPESGPRGLGVLERLKEKLKDVVPPAAPDNGATAIPIGVGRSTSRTEPTTPHEDHMPAPPIPNIFRGTSHDVIRGGDKFLKFLSEQPGVAKVTVDKINNRAHYTGEAGEFETAGHSVLAYYSSDGQKQKFRVFPNEHITVDRLHRRLQKAWNEKHQRGGAGQSSKDEVAIPPRIRQQQLQGTNQASDTLASEAPGRNDVSQSDEPDVIELTTQQAETYAYLLGLNPQRPAATDFSLEGVTALLTKQYKTKSQGSNRYIALISKGLIKPGDIVSGTANKKTSLIVHQRYRVVDRRGAVSTAEQARSRSPAPTPLAEPAVSSPLPKDGGTVARVQTGKKTEPVFANTLDGHLAFFERCAALEAELKKLTAERHRRERELRKEGLTITFVHGQAALLRIKR